MVSRNQLTTTKAIQRQTGKTFHFATRLLPRRVRHGTYVLYAFFRVADEIVDDPDAAPPDEQRRRLDRIEAGALGEREPDDPVVAAFRDVKERNGIDDREVEAFVDAMRMDVDKSRYESHDELGTYLRGSSVAVGHMMTSLMDPDDPGAARPHAKALGEAFQLTNFLRDVREDVLEYDRIYLPRERLEAHGVPVSQVENLEFSPAFAEVMRAELRRTERRYHVGVGGIEYLPDDSQFAVLLAAVLYADHHRLIRERGLDVLSERPTLDTTRRVALALRTWWHWRRAGDPVEAFYAASAIEPPADLDESIPTDPAALRDGDPGHRSPVAADGGSADWAPGCGAVRRAAGTVAEVVDPRRWRR